MKIETVTDHYPDSEYYHYLDNFNRALNATFLDNKKVLFIARFKYATNVFNKHRKLCEAYS